MCHDVQSLYFAKKMDKGFPKKYIHKEMNPHGTMVKEELTRMEDNS